MTREPLTTADTDAAESRDARGSTLNARHVPAHDHWCVHGECWCGETVDWADASV